MTKRKIINRATRMRDVAEAAGVGLTTVSRSFSEPDKVSPETLERIRSVVDKLRYTVNVNARSLRGNATGLVLVLIPDIGNSFFSPVLKGMEETARDSGHVILIADTQRDSPEALPYTSQSYLTQLDARRIDGMLVLDGTFPVDGPEVARLGRGYPVVAVAERSASGTRPYVGIDNVSAAREMVEYLADLGHRRIAHLAGPEQNISAAERLSGYRQGMERRGLNGEAKRIAFFDLTIDSARAGTKVLLAADPRPTAIFAASDEMAIGAIYEAKNAGLRVPEDISVVGFDDIGLSEVFDPPLSTIRQPRREIGRKGMSLVIDYLERAEPLSSETILPYELVRRRSAGLVG